MTLVISAFTKLQLYGKRGLKFGVLHTCVVFTG